MSCNNQEVLQAWLLLSVGPLYPQSYGADQCSVFEYWRYTNDRPSWVLGIHHHDHDHTVFVWQLCGNGTCRGDFFWPPKECERPATELATTKAPPEGYSTRMTWERGTKKRKRVVELVELPKKRRGRAPAPAPAQERNNATAAAKATQERAEVGQTGNTGKAVQAAKPVVEKAIGKAICLPKRGTKGSGRYV